MYEKKQSIPANLPYAYAAKAKKANNKSESKVATYVTLKSRQKVEAPRPGVCYIRRDKPESYFQVPAKSQISQVLPSLKKNLWVKFQK